MAAALDGATAGALGVGADANRLPDARATEQASSPASSRAASSLSGFGEEDESEGENKKPHRRLLSLNDEAKCFPSQDEKQHEE